MYSIQISFLIFILTLTTPAFGDETGASCGKYANFVASAEEPGIVFPDILLVDQKKAIPCLTAELHRLSDLQNSAEFDWKVTVQMNIVAGALRRVIESAKNDREPIGIIREHDTPEMVSLLAFGARSKDRSTRLNSTRLLGDIVDNDLVCVVMDHFSNPNFYETGAGLSGRINLASIVAVVAPWAYKENFNNIEALNKHLSAAVRDDVDADTIKRVLNRMSERLKFQEQLPSNKQLMQRSLTAAPKKLQGCIKYKPKWAKGNADFKLEGYPRGN